MDVILEDIAESVSNLVYTLSDHEASAKVKFAVQTPAVRKLKAAIQDVVKVVSETKRMDFVMKEMGYIVLLEDASRALLQQAENLLRAAITAQKEPDSKQPITDALNSARDILRSLSNLVLVEDQINVETLAWFTKEVTLCVRELNLATNEEEFAGAAKHSTEMLTLFATHCSTHLGGNRHRNYKDKLAVHAEFVTKTGPKQHWPLVTACLNNPDDAKSRKEREEITEKIVDTLEEMYKIIKLMFDDNQAYMDSAFKRPLIRSPLADEALSALKNAEKSIFKRSEGNEAPEGVTYNVSEALTRAKRFVTHAEKNDKPTEEAVETTTLALQDFIKNMKTGDTKKEEDALQKLQEVIANLRHVMVDPADALAASRNQIVDVINGNTFTQRLVPKIDDLLNSHLAQLATLIEEPPIQLDPIQLEKSKMLIEQLLPSITTPTIPMPKELLTDALDTAIGPWDRARARAAEARWNGNDVLDAAKRRDAKAMLEAVRPMIHHIKEELLDADSAAARYRNALRAKEIRDLVDNLRRTLPILVESIKRSANKMDDMEALNDLLSKVPLTLALADRVANASVPRANDELVGKPGNPFSRQSKLSDLDSARSDGSAPWLDVARHGERVRWGLEDLDKALKDKNRVKDVPDISNDILANARAQLRAADLTREKYDSMDRRREIRDAAERLGNLLSPLVDVVRAAAKDANNAAAQKNYRDTSNQVLQASMNLTDVAQPRKGDVMLRDGQSPWARSLLASNQVLTRSNDLLDNLSTNKPIPNLEQLTNELVAELNKQLAAADEAQQRFADPQRRREIYEKASEIRRDLQNLPKASRRVIDRPNDVDARAELQALVQKLTKGSDRLRELITPRPDDRLVEPSDRRRTVPWDEAKIISEEIVDLSDQLLARNAANDPPQNLTDLSNQLSRNIDRLVYNAEDAKTRLNDPARKEEIDRAVREIRELQSQLPATLKRLAANPDSKDAREEFHRLVEKINNASQRLANTIQPKPNDQFATPWQRLANLNKDGDTLRARVETSMQKPAKVGFAEEVGQLQDNVERQLRAAEEAAELMDNPYRRDEILSAVNQVRPVLQTLPAALNKYLANPDNDENQKELKSIMDKVLRGAKQVAEVAAVQPTDVVRNTPPPKPPRRMYGAGDMAVAQEPTPREQSLAAGERARWGLEDLERALAEKSNPNTTAQIANQVASDLRAQLRSAEDRRANLRSPAKRQELFEAITSAEPGELISAVANANRNPDDKAAQDEVSSAIARARAANKRLHRINCTLEPDEIEETLTLPWDALRRLAALTNLTSDELAKAVEAKDYNKAAALAAQIVADMRAQQANADRSAALYKNPVRQAEIVGLADKLSPMANPIQAAVAEMAKKPTPDNLNKLKSQLAELKAANEKLAAAAQPKESDDLVIDLPPPETMPPNYDRKTAPPRKRQPGDPIEDEYEVIDLPPPPSLPPWFAIRRKENQVKWGLDDLQRVLDAKANGQALSVAQQVRDDARETVELARNAAQRFQSQQRSNEINQNAANLERMVEGPLQEGIIAMTSNLGDTNAAAKLQQLVGDLRQATSKLATSVQPQAGDVVNSSKTYKYQVPDEPPPTPPVPAPAPAPAPAVSTSTAAAAPPKTEAPAAKLNKESDPEFYQVAEKMVSNLSEAKRKLPPPASDLAKVIQLGQTVAGAMTELGKAITGSNPRSIIDESRHVLDHIKAMRLAAKEIANSCPNGKLRADYEAHLSALESMCTQLKILAAVRASAGQNDLESRKMLLTLCQSLSATTSKAVEAAQICLLSRKK